MKGQEGEGLLEIPAFVRPRAEQAEGRPRGGCGSSQGTEGGAGFGALVTAAGREGTSFGTAEGQPLCPVSRNSSRHSWQRSRAVS